MSMLSERRPRIVSAAGETSGEQAARRAAVALADRLGIAVTYLPGGHGGWGSDPQELADRLHEALQAGLSRDMPPATEPGAPAARRARARVCARP